MSDTLPLQPEAASDYTYPDKKRANLPSAGRAAEGKVREAPKKIYDYDPHLPPRLRFDPDGSTANVNFKTKRECASTLKSHINQAVLDNNTWEAAARAALESSIHVVCYAKNYGMNFSIPYQENEISHAYIPDFLVRLADGATLILEIKGFHFYF